MNLQLFDKSKDPILLMSGNKYSHVNQAAVDILGFDSKEELIGCDPADLSPPFQNDGNPSLEKAEDMMNRAHETGFHRFEWTYQKRDGSIFSVDISLTHTDKETLCIWRDITRQKQIEKQLFKAEQQTRAAHQDKFEFLANMSHKIQTPMHEIIGMTHLALDSNPNKNQHNYLKKINNSAGRLLLLLSDILDFSKIESGQLLIEKQPFNLLDMLNTISSTMTGIARGKGLELIIEQYPSDLPAFVIGDEIRLRQVLLNLIDNAIKFTQKGSIRIRLTPEKTENEQLQLHFMVIDTGIGIPPEKQETVFSNYTQRSNGINHWKYDSSGLGLTICKHLVELMRGKIWVENEQDTSFHFTVILEQGNEKNIPQHNNNSTDKIKTLDILVVDDNIINSDILRYILEKDGHQIVTAKDGLESIEILANQKFDLVLMDIQMPVIDGLTASAIIRASEKNDELSQFNLPQSLLNRLVYQCNGKHIPIVAMSANTMDRDKQRCLAAGMDTYLPKPFKADQVREVIADTIRV